MSNNIWNNFKKFISSMFSFDQLKFKEKENIIDDNFNSSYLYDLCKLNYNKNLDEHSLGSETYTPRVNYLISCLNKMNVYYELDSWKSYIDEKLFQTNIIVPIYCNDDNNDEGIFVVAHHDIANPLSDNCFDNTASVVNLLNLIKRLKNRKNELNENVFIAFTDMEERGKVGAKALSKRINNGDYGDIKYIINNELTAKGDTVWVEDEGNENGELNQKIDKFEDRIVRKGFVPPNDSYDFRNYGIESLCFGILPNDQVEEDVPPIWRVCHTENDKYEDANFNEMNDYVKFLEKIIVDY